jgi:hypothetical protein
MRTQREGIPRDKNLQVRTEAAAKSAPAQELPASLLLTEGELEQIRQRAYQLYEERGRLDGFAEEDWLQAEAEILTQARKFSA